MKTGRKLIFGLLTALGILAAFEVILSTYSTVSGQDWRVNPLPAHPEYSVICEFGDMLRLCPDQGPKYERVRPEVFFKEKTGRRIIAIGESFVYGLGLPANDSWPGQLKARLGENVEVINMGRCGTYASRLVPILKAALTLDPDVIVLSTGNNEHTMTSFYTGPLGRQPLKSYKLMSTLGVFQTYGLLYRQIAGPDIKFRESFTEAPKNFENDTDQQVYAARRRPPNMQLFPDGLATPLVTTILEQEQRLKELIFKDHLQEMIRLSSEANVPMILTTLPRDLAVPPVLSGVHAQNESEVRRIAKGLQARDPRSQEDWVSQGLKEDDKVSLFLYEKGMISLREGNLKEAAKWIRQNISWELVPDATPEINQIVRNLANQNQLQLIDLDVYAEQYLTNPQTIFLDKVHVNARGASEIADQIAPAIQTALSEQ
ncbi:MAG: hypothetical protein VXZ96_20175 [Myxococcota bacterium]|nr:hypothetical protein [Myxococcota bacterium]